MKRSMCNCDRNGINGWEITGTEGNKRQFDLKGFLASFVKDKKKIDRK
jgi:hypothetical protein